MPGSEVPVGRDLPGQSELVAPASVVPVLLVLLRQRLAPRSQTLLQGFLVLGSVDNTVLIGPGVLTVPVGTELQSQAGQIRRNKIYKKKFKRWIKV